MRIRSLVTIALLLPVVAGAQRSAGTRIGGRRPVPVAPLPPQPGAIAREMQYVPKPYSVESYTFISYLQEPLAPTNALTSWGTLGAGTRLDYRLNEYFSVTGDMTNSMFFGPTVTGSVELGTRLRPVSADIDSKMRPYMDVRLGYIYSYQSYAYSTNPTAVVPAMTFASRMGSGVGAIGGVGSDYSLTETLFLTTGLWATRTHLQSSSLWFQPVPSTHQRWWQTSYRLALGLRWNPMYAIATGGGR